jgi:hypothetical protein
VTLGRYGLTDHQVWAVSSVLALVGLLGMVAASARTPEYRTGWAMTMRDWKSEPGDIVESAVFVLYLIVMVLAPIIIALGVAPELEAALYLTAVALGLLMGALNLFVAVFWQQNPSGSADRGGPPTSGASSA